MGNVGAIHESPVLNVDRKGEVFLRGFHPLGYLMGKGDVIWMM